MGLLQTVKGLFGRSSTEAPRHTNSELAAKLDKMRGNNVTVVDSGGNIPPNRDGMKNLNNAARDARSVNRSNEDEALKDLTTYRQPE